MRKVLWHSRDIIKSSVVIKIGLNATVIAKHAMATRIRIALTQHPGYIELEIADNGKGFNLQQAKKGIGLSNIIYRAEAYGGKISIVTDINKGCKLNIRFNI
jgi:signal transduction histidine kinase